MHAWASAGAALHGHLMVLKWLRDNGCPWDASTCFQAASGGHLNVLKWLRNNGCPKNAGASARAASEEHLEVLKWLQENGFWDFSVLGFQGFRVLVF